MFHIKICGVRLSVDVQAVQNCGGDAIGLNFFPASVRYVDPTSPRTTGLSRLAAAGGLLRVGVFVNEQPERIAGIVQQVGLDAIQLHGDESLETAVEIVAAAGTRWIRAVKLPIGPINPGEIAARVDPWLAAGCQVLLDAEAGAAHGGSGRCLDWPSIAAWADRNAGAAWTLAGGLTPENVGEAILDSGARSVDVASGVEETRGVKSEWLIRRFVVEAKAAMGG
jgi:phosphoribosylanthranilate isomerase